MNPMRDIRVEKVTLNVGTKEDAETLEKGVLMLKKIAGKEGVITRTHRRTTFGSAKGRKIGTKLTLRGNEAKEFLLNALKGVDNRLKPSQFDRTGNFSFGVKEYINMPGVKYDPDIGILGFDVTVTLERPGFRIKRRKLKSSKVGKKHLITPEEAIEWAKKELNVNVTDAEE